MLFLKNLLLKFYLILGDLKLEKTGDFLWLIEMIKYDELCTSICLYFSANFVLYLSFNITGLLTNLIKISLYEF